MENMCSSMVNDSIRNEKQNFQFFFMSIQYVAKTSRGTKTWGWKSNQFTPWTPGLSRQASPTSSPAPLFPVNSFAILNRGQEASAIKELFATSSRQTLGKRQQRGKSRPMIGLKCMARQFPDSFMYRSAVQQNNLPPWVDEQKTWLKTPRSHAKLEKESCFRHVKYEKIKV